MKTTIYRRNTSKKSSEIIPFPFSLSRFLKQFNSLKFCASKAKKEKRQIATGIGLIFVHAHGKGRPPKPLGKNGLKDSSLFPPDSQ